MLTENVAQSDLNLSEEENPNKVSCLVSQYENTPFLFVEADEGVFLAIGNNRLTDVMKNKETLDEWVTNNQWNLIGSFVMSLINNVNNLKINEQ